MNTQFPAIILGGISLTGKSTLATQLKENGLLFNDIHDGDDLHTEESVNKMRFGIALGEDDRVAWKERICDKIRQRPEGRYRVIACSALSKRFREDLRKSGEVRFIFLVFRRESAEKRARKRLRDTWVQIHERPHEKQHYYQPAIYPQLLDGQYGNLQIPGPDESDCYVVDLDQFPSGEFGPQVDFSILAPKILEWLEAR